MLHSLDAHRYTPDAIREAFGLRSAMAKRTARQTDDSLHHAAGTHPEVIRERVMAFRSFLQGLRDRRMLKSSEPDMGGWIEVSCPWSGDHTARADNGAAIRMPSEENLYHGAFKCHHGGCAERGWRELTDWLAEEAAAGFEEAANECH